MSEFPNLTEVLPDAATGPARRSTRGLPRHRYAEAFESLRDRGRRPRRGHRGPPRGSPWPRSAHRPRTAPGSPFAQNLFAAGGIETVVVPAADADRAGGLPVRTGQGVRRVRRRARRGPCAAGGTGHVWLAGRPAGYDGVESYVYTGCDAVAVLTEVLHQLGVAS